MSETVNVLRRAKARLFAMSPFIAAGAVASVMTAHDPVAGTAVAVVQTLAALASDIAAADVHAKLSERVAGDDVLKNHDLARAVRNAICAIIREASREATSREEKEALEKLAADDEERWTEAEQAFWLPGTVEKLSSGRVVEMFSLTPDEFANFRALEPDDWKGLVAGLAAVSGVAVEGGLLSARVALLLSEETVGRLAHRLHETFPRALYEILKEDFAHDGKAYGGLLLKLVGNISGKQVETLEAAYATLRVTEKILSRLEATDGTVGRTFDNTEKILAELRELRSADQKSARPESEQAAAIAAKALEGAPPLPPGVDLLAEATCAVLLNDVLQATAWLVSGEGHLLTAGHIFLGEDAAAEIRVQFLNEGARRADRLTSIYNPDTGDDFALLKLEDVPPNRRPLSVSLKQKAEGACTLQGYGKTFYQQTSCEARLAGTYYPQNFSGNRMFVLRLPEQSRAGFSGAAVFSTKSKAVIAIQTGAAAVGEDGDEVLAMPLYRIAQRWNDLYRLEKAAREAGQESPSRYSSPKSYLEHRIRENLHFYQACEDSAGGPGGEAVAEDSSGLLRTKYRQLIGYYLQLYFLLCRRLRVPPKADVEEISRGFSEVEHPDEARALSSATLSDIYTGIPGTRIKVNVSQMFRIADLLTQPGSVKAKGFYKAITTTSKMRRTFSGGKPFKIGLLGELHPVIKKSDDYVDFWKVFVPDLKLPTAQPICFVPYELNLTSYLQTLRSDLGSVFDPARWETYGGIRNAQVNGRLRIYPTGIGIVSLGLALEFKEEIHAEVVAKIAHNIEGLLFVDPLGMSRPYSHVIVDIIEQVIKYLFVNEGYDFSERRWRPPMTTYSFTDAGNLRPEEKINELAYLMSLAPANGEDIQYLFDRIRKALWTAHWKTHRMLAVAGDGVGLFFVDDLPNGGGARRRNKIQLWLSETHELISAAAYAQQAYAEEIDSIFNQGLLDDTWLPEQGVGFAYLQGLLETMRQVMRAISSIGGENGRLQRQGTGLLMNFAREVWTYSNPLNRPALEKGLSYIDDWLKEAQSRAPDERIARLRGVVGSLRGFKPLFVERAHGARVADGTAEQAQMEALLLDQLAEIEGILKEGEPERPEEDERQRKIMQKLRRQLGLM
jgi:hypothetical protein